MLVGRERELSHISDLIRDARESRGGALVLHGQPGIGKSALVLAARDRADGMQVLATQGVESESPLAFAALQRLLRPIMADLAILPAVQVGALRAVFGQDGGEIADRFVVFLATLGLLSAAADRSPVLCLVDDAQWLDDASAAALQFAARRLDRERVAMLFATRDGDVRQFDRTGLPDVAVRGLDHDAARLLLTGQAPGQVTAAVGAQLIRLSGGNPLALVELPGTLSAGQLAGAEPLPHDLPLTDDLQRAFLDRYRRLSVPARTLLLLIATDSSISLGHIQRAAVQLSPAPSVPTALDEAERSGLLRTDGVRADFRHPLVRSAIYQAATSSERRRAHRALADTLDGLDDADRRAWHLAEAAVGPDEDAAAALDDAAQLALGRSGYEAASSAFERAAALSVSDGERVRRLTAAAGSAWLGAQPVRTGRLAAEGLRYATDRLARAELDQLRGRAEFHVGSVATAVGMWTRAARDVARLDPVRALELAVMAAAASTFVPPADRTGLDPAELPTELRAGAPPRQRCLTGLLYGFRHLLDGQFGRAREPFRTAFDAAPSSIDPDLANAIGIASFHLGDDETFRQTFSRLLGSSRERGALGLVQFALPRLALADLCAGRLNDAIVHAAEARQLAAASDQVGLTAMPLAELALYAAYQGDDSIERYLDELDEVLADRQVGVLGALVQDARRWALGERDLAVGRYADALHHLKQISTPPMMHLAGYARLDAAVRAERLDTAQTWWQELSGFAAAAGSPHDHALAAYGAALLAGKDGAQHFERAIGFHRHSGRPLDAARTRLAYGEFLRRGRQRVAARAHLREALTTFEDLGAAPLAERARQELRASGETARRRDPATAVEFTAQERQVAKFVASGLSNRDVAAQLFLSPRTIDFHLRNVFTKAGISSRAELVRLDLG